MTWVRLWWRQADHYDWIYAYLRDRGLARLVRTLVAGLCVPASLIPVVLMTIPEGPHGSIPRFATGLAAFGVLALSLLWVGDMPNRRQSIVFAIGISTCIGAVVLSCSDPRVGILVATTFAIVAGYIAFAHTAIQAVYNFNLAMLVATVETIRLGSSGHWRLALCALWLVFALTLSVPMGIQIILRSLGIDLLDADSDPLTFVLNRRALAVKIRDLIRRGREADTHLLVMVIDLDHFKQLNDTLGHATGDRALVAVAQQLQGCTRDSAVIGRTGGDEFLIADTTDRPQQATFAERLRQEIAAMPYPITASIGVVTTALTLLNDPATESRFEDVVAAADRMMYTAKRNGGNQIQHSIVSAASPE